MIEISQRNENNSGFTENLIKNSPIIVLKLF